jgi:putative ABC transport system ATP-binding protein
VVTVSHDAATAGEADRGLRIRDGRIEAELGPGEEARLVDLRGWVRLPAELLDPTGIGQRLRVRRAPGGAGLLLTGAGGGGGGGGATLSPELSADPQAELEAGGRDVSWVPAHVSLRDVQREYRDGPHTRVVLDGFSADFGPGRLTVVRGRSGTGKTTLLRLVAGLEAPDAGEVLVDGTAYAPGGGEALAALRRERIGYLPQDPWPVGFLSAQENVVLALRLRGEAPARAGARASAALASVGLEERAGQRVSRLSAGEAQRVGLARALACARGLLILDEPTSRLDEKAAGQMGELLMTAARQRAHTIICASHDEQLISRADSVVSLSG